jgi:hypothetical protein
MDNWKKNVTLVSWAQSRTGKTYRFDWFWLIIGVLTPLSAIFQLYRGRRYKGLIRIRKSKKNRQHNGPRKKDERRSAKHTHNAKDRVPLTPLKTANFGLRTIVLRVLYFTFSRFCY